MAYKDKEKAKAAAKRWYEKNKENIRQYNHEKRQKIADYQKKWKDENKEYVLAKKKEYRKKNAEKQGRDYKNIEEVRAIAAQRRIKATKASASRSMRKSWRQATDHIRYNGKSREAFRYHNTKTPENILAGRMRKMIYQAIKGYEGSISWQDILGFTKQDLVNHIESKFYGGMTWDDVREGRVHIDHIVPRYTFDIKSPYDQEFFRCFSLDNLQPLWAEHNREKGGNIEPYTPPIMVPSTMIQTRGN